jgi:hypothetical protein
MRPTKQEPFFRLTLDDGTGYRNVVYIKYASYNNYMQDCIYLNESTMDIKSLTHVYHPSL